MSELLLARAMRPLVLNSKRPSKSSVQLERDPLMERVHRDISSDCPEIEELPECWIR
jgi:hypothetical protein